MEYHHHRHHHHHHGHSSVHGSTNSSGVATMQTLNPSRAHATDGIQTTGSFHSVSSMDSSAEMSKYFPDAPTPGLPPIRHQQVLEGQAPPSATSNTLLNTNVNPINTTPYVYVSAPTAVKQLPQQVREISNMSQQQPTQSSGQPQLPPGIPSYSSQIEGLSVSQAVVNDVLVDLQSKVINETLNQYHEESSGGAYLEPLAPVYIRAPQPTIIIQSDLNRLRAELGNRVRPPVIYRHPAGANQFQQHEFQQNTFETPLFPTSGQPNVPPECTPEYYNATYGNRNMEKINQFNTEQEGPLHSQIGSSMLNIGNINNDVQNAFDFQGLSTKSFDRHASPYQSPLLPNVTELPQVREATIHTSPRTNNINDSSSSENMFFRPDSFQQGRSFNINDCILRCLEASRQRDPRFPIPCIPCGGQQQTQHLNYSFGPTQYENISQQSTYPSFGTVEQTLWTQQQQLQQQQQQQPPISSTVYSAAMPESTGTYSYINPVQGHSLSNDIQQYQSSTIDSTVPIDVQSSITDRFQYKTIQTQEPYIHSNLSDYSSYQEVPSASQIIEPTSIQQQNDISSYDYSSQTPYQLSSRDATVPSNAQELSSQYYQEQGQQTTIQPSASYTFTTEAAQSAISNYDQQNRVQPSFQYSQATIPISQQQATKIPTSLIASSQPTGTVEYTRETYQSQEPFYNGQNVQLTSSQIPYDINTIEQQQQSFNYQTTTPDRYAPVINDAQSTLETQNISYGNQMTTSAQYYQQQPITVSTSQFGPSQPTGTFEYTNEMYQSQEPIYNYQDINQTLTQYSSNTENIEQQLQQQQQGLNYSTATSSTYFPSEYDSQQFTTQQTVDYSTETLAGISQPTGTFEYTREGYQTQQPIYNIQSADEQKNQYYKPVQQITKQNAYEYTSRETLGYPSSQLQSNLTDQGQSFQYDSQVYNSSDYYQEQSVPISQYQGEASAYATQDDQSQQSIYNYQNIQQVPSQYAYHAENLAEHQSVDYTISSATDQAVEYSDEKFNSTAYIQQQTASVPITPTTQWSTDQPTGTFEYSKETHQSQQPLYEYQHGNQQISNYPYNFTGIEEQQQQAFTYQPDSTTTYATSAADIQQSEQMAVNNYYQNQSVSIPASQNYDSQIQGQLLDGQSIPSGTVEYTRKVYFAQEPILDNYLTKASLTQQQQKYETTNLDNYAQEFKFDSYPQLTGGQIQSSDNQLSFTTTSTAPLFNQQQIHFFPYQGATQQYDLQNYTNEPVVSEESYRSIVIPSRTYEEERQRLLQQSTIREQIYEPVQQPEYRTEMETSMSDTYSSFPPPPQSMEQNTYEQETYVTNVADFPLPPIDNYNRSSRELAQYKEEYPIEQNVKIAQDSIITGLTSDVQQIFPRSEIHYTDAWTQTPSLDIIAQSDIVQHKYDQTPSSFDTKPYIPKLTKGGLILDSRGQQTIEYSPPLVIPSRHTLSTIPQSVPLLPYEYSVHEREQQPMYDHILPVPPHLSFNDIDYQPNFYFPGQITAQPRQNQNLPFITHEQKENRQPQKQRYRAHSEPTSIQQNTIASVVPLQSTTTRTFEHQPRRSVSIPMFRQSQSQPRIPSARILDNGYAYETDSTFQRRGPRIDPVTGECLVPCPQMRKYSHLPPHLRPELYCIELPPPSLLPPPPPAPSPPLPPPQPQMQAQRVCVKCCCVPGRSLVKKIVYRQTGDSQQQNENESYIDYASVIDQMATRISVRYGNNVVNEGDAFFPDNYNEQLRIIDFPVYAGENESNLTPLIPAN